MTSPEAASSDGRLHVALPLLTYVPGGMGGSETYVSELTRDLVGRDDVRVTVGLPEIAKDFLPTGQARVAHGVRGGGSARERVLSQLRAERSPAARAIVRGADVVHYPLTVPSPRPPRGTPVVQTLLDTQHHDLGQNFSRAEKVYRRLRYDAPARRADAVITISDFCKERITDHLGIAPERIHVAHLGVDADAFRPNLGEREDFVLYPARSWPHKNHQRLVEAMVRVRETRPGMRLVLTGGALETLGELPPWVEVKGLVSRDELLSLYRRAACLAFPSLYEGFGLPPLEAMASGCPVAAATSGSLPEVCGDAAVMFDAHRPESIASAVLEAVEHRESLVARGLDRSRQFTWQRCADVHVRTYAEVAGTRTGAVG